MKLVPPAPSSVYVGRPSLEPSGMPVIPGALTKYFTPRIRLLRRGARILVVEHRSRAHGLGCANGESGADRRLRETCSDLDTRPALDVREQRKDAREREGVVLRQLDVQLHRRTDRRVRWEQVPLDRRRVRVVVVEVGSVENGVHIRSRHAAHLRVQATGRDRVGACIRSCAVLDAGVRLRSAGKLPALPAGERTGVRFGLQVPAVDVPVADPDHDGGQRQEHRTMRAKSVATWPRSDRRRSPNPVAESSAWPRCGAFGRDRRPCWIVVQRRRRHWREPLDPRRCQGCIASTKRCGSTRKRLVRSRRTGSRLTLDVVRRQSRCSRDSALERDPRAQVECVRVPRTAAGGPTLGRRAIRDADRAGTRPASAHGRARPLEGSSNAREHPSATELERAAEPSRGSEEPGRRGRRGAQHATPLLRAVAPAMAHLLRPVAQGRLGRRSFGLPGPLGQHLAENRKEPMREHARRLRVVRSVAQRLR